MSLRDLRLLHSYLSNANSRSDCTVRSCASSIITTSYLLRLGSMLIYILSTYDLLSNQHSISHECDMCGMGCTIIKSHIVPNQSTNLSTLLLGTSISQCHCSNPIQSSSIIPPWLSYCYPQIIIGFIDVLGYLGGFTTSSLPCYDDDLVYNIWYPIL